jgi:hypothetical protein
VVVVRPGELHFVSNVSRSADTIYGVFLPRARASGLGILLGRKGAEKKLEMRADSIMMRRSIALPENYIEGEVMLFSLVVSPSPFSSPWLCCCLV